MQINPNVRRLTGTVALVAAAAGGLAACVVTGPTATLADHVLTVAGTEDTDHITVTVDTDEVAVDLDADGAVDARFARADVDRLVVLAGGGDDGVSVTGTGALPTTVDGGSGNDGIGVVGHIGSTGAGDAPTTVTGGDGDDNLFVATPGPVTVDAGSGNDRVEGGGAGVGQEQVVLGDGDDRFVSSLNTFIGARTDVVDGGTGQDSLEMEGSFADESVSLAARGSHLLVTHELRDHVDAVHVEDVTYRGFGGSDAGDAISIDDLSGTDVTRVTPDFSVDHDSTTADNSAETLTIRGTAGADHITVSGSQPKVLIEGLDPTISAVNLRPEDVLRIETLAGDDAVDRSGLPAGVVGLQVL